MGSFSLAGGKSKSTSSSSSLGLGYGYTGSTSESLSSGASQSTNASQSASSQRIAFEDLFAQLYGGASSVTGRLAANAPALSEQAQLLFSGGTQFLEGLGGGAGEDYLASRLGPNAELDEQIAGLSADIGDFFRNEINPAISSSAIGNGQLGGGRQGVAQGLAAKAAAREFQTGVTNLRTQDLAARDAAARELMAGRTAAAGTALTMLPGMLDLATGGFNAELAPYAALAGILGGPTTLTESTSTATGQSSSSELARAISEALGENFSYDTSSSTSRGKAWNFSTSGSFLS